jgi:hypothetical protein
MGGFDLMSGLRLPRGQPLDSPRLDSNPLVALELRSCSPVPTVDSVATFMYRAAM